MRNIEDDRELVSLERPSTVTQNAQSGITDPRTYGVQLYYKF